MNKPVSSQAEHMLTPHGPHSPIPWRWEETGGAGIQIFGPLPFPAECVEFRLKEGDQPIFGIRWRLPGDHGNEQLIAYETWLQFPPKEWTEMQKANAEFIVRACNGHAALVAALIACESFIADSGNNGAAQILAQSRAALAQAKQ